MRRALLCLAVLASGCLDLDKLGHVHDLGEDMSVGDMGELDIGASTLEWTRASTGLPSSNVLSLAVFGTGSSATYWAGTAQGGVWKSVGDLESWTWASASLDQHTIAAIAVDGTGIPYVSGGIDGVWKSSDGGVTWIRTPAFPTGASDDVLALLATGTGADAMVWAGSSTGVYLSTSAGTGAWTALTAEDMGTGPTDVRQLWMGSDKTVYAASDATDASGGIYAWTTDAAWHHIFPGVAAHGVTTSATTPAKLFMITDTANRSPLWSTPLTTPPTWTQTVFSPAAAGSAIAVDSTGTANVATAAGLFLASTSVTLVSTPTYLMQINALLEVPGAAPLMLAAHVDGISSSPDGQTWTEHVTGLDDANVTVLVTDPSAANGAYVGMSTSGRLFHTLNGGTTWTAASIAAKATATPSEGAIKAIAVDSVTTSRLYAGTATGFYSSTTHGAGWMASPNPAFAMGVTAIAIDPGSENTIYVSTATGVYKSTDGASTFTALTGVPTNVAALLVTANAVYAGTSVKNGSTISRSNDGGMTWATIDNGLSAMPITALAAGSSVDVVYAAVNGSGVYKTSNGGALWHGVTTGLSNLNVVALTARSDAPDILYTTAASGVYQSIDGAATWHYAIGGLTNTNASAVAVMKSGAVLVGTTASGVYVGH